MSHLKRRRDISSPYCNSNRIAYATLQSNFLCLNLMSSRIDAKSSAFLFTSSQVLLAQTWASTYTRFIGAMNLVVAFPFSSISICFFFQISHEHRTALAISCFQLNDVGKTLFSMSNGFLSFLFARRLMYIHCTLMLALVATPSSNNFFSEYAHFRYPAECSEKKCSV